MIRTRAAAPFPLWFHCPLWCRLAFALLLCAAPALAQTTALPTLTTEIKTALDATSYKASIQQFVDAAVALLGSASPEDQAKARVAMRSESMVTGQPKASPGYLDIYTQLLAPALLNLTKSEDMRVRLNAAIVTAQIAQLADNTNLAPVAIALIGDKSDAVVLWGLKAARWIIPAQLKLAKPDTKLMAAILPAVKAHPKGTIGGAIALEAYDALALDVTNPARMKLIAPAMISVVIPFVQDLMGFRVTLYQLGVPPDPHAERSGATFLVNPNVWPLESPAQQLKTIQMLSDLLSLASQQAKAPALSSMDVKELLGTIETVARSISVVPGMDAGVVAAVAPLNNITRGTPPTQVASMATAVYPAIKASTTYGKVTPPPAVTGNAPPPPPASAPTTGPVVIPGAIPVPPPGATPGPGGPTTRSGPAPAPRPGTPPTPAPGPGNTGTPPRPTPRPPAYPPGAGK